MAKRRSSIKGRGSEILFGAPQPVDIQPLAGEPDVDEAESPEPESAEPEQPEASSPQAEEEEAALLDDAELEALLREEAEAGAPDPEGTLDPEVLETEAPLPSEVETSFFEEAVAAEEPPEPVAELPIPEMEVTVEESEMNEETARHQPPPPETANLAGDILPPRPGLRVFDLGETDSLASAEIQEGEGVAPIELPERELSDEEKEELLARLGKARLRELDAEITKTYDQILTKVGENEDITNECHNLLIKARDIILRRDAARIPQAEYYIEQVRARLKRATESEAGAKKYAWWIAGWGLLWFIAYIAVLILLNYEWFREAVVPIATANTPVQMDIFLPAMVWGGIGGVAAVFYSLFKHVGRRDFDTQYNLSYVGKPFLGVILGATVYMVIHLLIMTLGILPAGLAEAGEGLSTPTVAPWIIYLMAWACGFKENRIFDLVDRVMKQIFSGREADPGAAAEPPEPTG
jgi:hypothetical protein